MAETPKIGLALGSGAARGLAHIGVLQVLQENNIKISCVAGTSIGSIVGAYYALNLDIKPLEERVTKMTKKDFLKLVDLTSPNRAIIAGEKIKKFLTDIFEDKEFKDLKIPLKVIATDLFTGEAIVINEGKLADACRASISIPGIFLPVKYGDTLLVDGGIVNSTPQDIAKSMGADIVITVDLPVIKPRKDVKVTLVGALMQSFEIMREKINRLKEDEKTLIIRPNVSDGLTGHQFYNKNYIEEGKKAAEKEMPRIKKMIESC